MKERNAISRKGLCVTLVLCTGLVLSSGSSILLLGQRLGTRFGSPHCRVTQEFFLEESKQVSKDFCLGFG